MIHSLDTASGQTSPKIGANAERLLYFPVRHHSPAGARLAAAAVRELRPDAVLIEGPSDFNERIEELALDHSPPIAVYSWVVTEGGERRGAYYPFCVYSPEWQVLRAGFRVGAEVAFIDLPWADLAAERHATLHRYADAELRRSRYVDVLCRNLEVEDFDAAWDRLFEIEELDLATYVERCGELCSHLRAFSDVSAADLRREDFMAARIAEARARHGGLILVLTGGFHSAAVRDRVAGGDFGACSRLPELGEGRGIALTPYSYESLDRLAGYESGMPNPGFYHRLWLDRGEGRRDTWRHLLHAVARELRRHGQVVSTADLIAVETTARGLAALRGHAEPWRGDLLDGVLGALVKEQTEAAAVHPMLDAAHRVLRGGERGRLAAGTTLPALVRELFRRLGELDLDPRKGARRELDLDLFEETALERSRLLHAARLLGIRSFTLLASPDLIARDDLTRLSESWRIALHRDFEATAIEAAAYGPTVREAVAARLFERSGKIERDAEAAARLLIDAALAGIRQLSGLLHRRLAALLVAEASFVRLARALGHLLYLYRYDPVLRTTGRQDVGALVRLAAEWALVRLEGLGHIQKPEEGVDGLVLLLEAFERCGDELELDRQGLIDVLARLAGDGHQLPAIRGAALGALWTLGAAGGERLEAELDLFARPDELGDFLAGLFALAREAVQRRRQLVARIDDLVLDFDDQEFLHALPALRLAFSRFTPREKHQLIHTLLSPRREADGMLSDDSPPAEIPIADIEHLDVPLDAAARMIALEDELARRLARYRLRGLEEENR